VGAGLAGLYLARAISKNAPVRPRVAVVIPTLLYAAATFLFAEPTPASMAIGAPVVVGGLVGWFAACVGDDGRCPSDRGGVFRYVRNPRELAAFLLAMGFVLFAASEEPRGRWVPRTVAPLGLLYFFAVLLPLADARLRERVRRDGGERGAEYLTAVPSLVPRLRPWGEGRVSSAAVPRAILETLAVAAAALALAAGCAARQGLVATIGF
jgi:hypothetical protein